MLILLPPSETKAPGGTGAPLDLTALSFPQLNGVREQIIADLISLDIDGSDGRPGLMDVLGVSPSLRPDAEADLVLRSSPTMPALNRYTGVLYDALDAGTLTDADPGAWARLAVGSALFGLLRADDPVPRYRLSAGTKLPARGTSGTAADGPTVPTMKKRWGRLVTEVLSSTPDGSGDGVIVDLRSGGYQALGPVPGAVTVRVESVRPDGSRKVVSHFNKQYKGLLARILATAGDRADAARDAVDVAAIAREAGMTVEINGPVGGRPPRDSLTLLTPGN